MMKTRIILSGPESSGKSTLAAALAERLGWPMAPEYARVHLEAGRPYPQSAEELADLARLHLDWQRRHVPADSPAGILDTDMLNYRIWADVAFGTVPDEIGRWFLEETGHIHLLCAPDLPWHPDPLRGFPDGSRRRELFDRHRSELECHGIRHFVIRGTGDARLAMAESVVREVAGSVHG